MVYVLKNQKKKIYVSEVIFVSRVLIRILHTSVRHNAKIYPTVDSARTFLNDWMPDDGFVIQDMTGRTIEG